MLKLWQFLLTFVFLALFAGLMVAFVLAPMMTICAIVFIPFAFLCFKVAGTFLE